MIWQSSLPGQAKSTNSRVTSNLALVLSMLEAKDLICKDHMEPTLSDTANRFGGKNENLYVVPSMIPERQPVPSVSVEWNATQVYV